MPRIFGSHITGPRILVAVLVLFYGAFWIWYGGAGRPLSPQEIERYFALLDERAEEGGSGGLRARLEDWARKDDGREFPMVNLMDDPADPRAAEAYNAMILPALIRRDLLEMVTAPETKDIQHL